jgi:hypothetical protein
MPDFPGSVNWSPEHVWGLLDQSLLNLRMQEIAHEMQRKHVELKQAVHGESLQKNNSGFYAPERCRREAALADEWAERYLQASLRIWEVQGHTPCPSLYRAVHSKLLIVLFAARKSSVTGEMMLEYQRTAGRHPNTRAALAEFGREMNRLSHRWQQKLEIMAKECEHKDAIERSAQMASKNQEARDIYRATPAALVIPEKGNFQPSTWHQFYEQFTQVATEERSFHGSGLIAQCVFGDDYTGDVWRWRLNQRVTESLKERFATLASYTGAALGPLPRDATPLDYWLHRLRQFLCESRSSLIRRIRSTRTNKNNVEITMEVPIIESVCEASGQFCLRLERDGINAVHSKKKSLDDCYREWIVDNSISLTIPGGATDRNIVDLLADCARTAMPIEFLSSRLDLIRLSEDVVVSGSPGKYFDELAAIHKLHWWITERGLWMAQEPPPDLTDVDANGSGTEKVNQQEQLASARPQDAAGQGLLLKFKSPIKRAILLALSQKPTATDLEICRMIDDDGSAELPKDWQTGAGGRSFEDAYRNASVKHRVENTITKVRRELKKKGWLPTS